jgi:hypothetical protein
MSHRFDAERLAAVELIRSHGWDPTVFVIERIAEDRIPGDGLVQSRYRVRVSVPTHGQAREYEGGDEADWLRSFAVDLDGWAFVPQGFI